MCLLKLPNELLIPMGVYLQPIDIYSLMLTSKFLALIFEPVLQSAAMKEYEGMPSIHWAVRQGHLPLVRMLLTKGVRVDTCMDKLYTPLIFAAKHGRREIVKFLLEKGADIDARDDTGCTALIQATRNDNIAVCRLLLSKGATDDSTEYCHRYGFARKSTALHWAVSAKYANEGLIILMLKHGGNVNSLDCLGGTVLHRALSHRNYGLIKLILDSGVNINAQDSTLSAALHKAVWDSRLVKLLLDYGANTELETNYGETPLRLAIMYNRRGSVKMLLEHGANANVRDRLGGTLLDLARRDSMHDIVALLKQYHAADD